MRRRWPAVAAIAISAAAIVNYKQWVQVRTPVSNTAASIAQSETGLSILLVADPREAGESDGCGEIIRMVRKASERGIPLREVAPDEARRVTSRYHIVVSPTVLVLENGSVSKRYEGESPETVASVRAELRALEEHR